MRKDQLLMRTITWHMSVCFWVHDPRRAQWGTNHGAEASILASWPHLPRGDTKGHMLPLRTVTSFMLFARNLLFLSYFYVVLHSMTARISPLAEVKSPHCMSSCRRCLSLCKAEWLAPAPAAVLSLLGSHPGPRESLGGRPCPESGAPGSGHLPGRERRPQWEVQGMGQGMSVTEEWKVCGPGIPGKPRSEPKIFSGRGGACRSCGPRWEARVCYMVCLCPALPCAVTLRRQTGPAHR